MRDIASIANQLTDDMCDAGYADPMFWNEMEKEAVAVLTEERERCALLADFYKTPVLAKAIRDGAFVDDDAGAWWE